MYVLYRKYSVAGLQVSKESVFPTSLGLWSFSREFVQNERLTDFSKVISVK